jgi:hypothetical protein
MKQQYPRTAEGRVVPIGEVVYVKPKVTAVVPPLRGIREAEPKNEPFTRGVFEDALDKVSRPVKGKYADILPSSEEFIRDKRKEVELEDR